VLALLFSVSIGESIIGKLLAQWTLDRFIRWDPTITEDNIVLVDITEEDYADIFQKKRPLSPDVIVKLIRAAHDAGAKVVAVDISTADWEAKDGTLVSKIPSDAAVVWARGFYLDQSAEKSRMRLEPLLGGSDAGRGECYGVPALGLEAGVVRYFYSGLDADQWEPSFVDQILFRSKNGSCMEPGSGQEEVRIINFSAKIARKESARTLLRQSAEKGWSDQKQYAGKIVLLGGSFHSGSDTGLTPVGARSGLEIIGDALSTATRSEPRKELGKGWSIAIDAGIGLLLLAAGLLGSRVQIGVTVVLTALLGYSSLYTFRQYYLFVSFIPFVLGVGAHLCLGWIHKNRGETSTVAIPNPTAKPESS
jgi:CHASE2 domain-containing sensor protein